MTTVLLVDDDRALRKLLRAYLEAGVDLGARGRRAARRRSLRSSGPRRRSSCSTCGCPGSTASRCCGGSSARGRAVPVMLVTSLEDEVDQLVGYRLGAVDYVVKPVSPKVLAAKVKAFATARRRARRGSDRTSAGRSRRARRAPRARRRRRGAADPPRVRPARGARRSTPAGSTRATTSCSRSGGSTPSGVETRLVDQHVANLRRKLAAAGRRRAACRRCAGVGYRLVASRQLLDVL